MYRWSLAGGLLAGVWLAGSLMDCTPVAGGGQTDFLNMHDSVAYVGMATCRTCHANVHETFRHTGMGRSFGRATPVRSSAVFGDHALVRDTLTGYSYFPFFRDSVLYIREFRLQGKDTVHNRVERVSWIIGSGHHTNSHIIDRNGFLYQAPITYYTQSRRWDMAPGYEGGANSRFSRILTTECLTCHNHFPGHVAGSENKYFDMPEGIECERCHGPGALHVKAIQSGKMVDTSRMADRTIVNPRRLHRDRQTDLCQRCHLQGVAVLRQGKTFFDFRPGMALSEVMHVFLPRYSDSRERFLMASQAERLVQSACYRQSESLTCITCHNPHVSVLQTGREQYNTACRNCHGTRKCTAPEAERKARKEDCSGCHMPASESIDIPHVSITDHFIRKDYQPVSGDGGKSRFLGLEPMTRGKVEPEEMAQAYIALYEKFIPDRTLLDSAGQWLGRARGKEAVIFPVRVHWLFAREDYGALGRLADQRDTSGLDGWTAYRLGEACMRTMRHKQGLAFLARAAHVSPYHLEFLEKYGVALGVLQKGVEAERVFRRVLVEDPARPLALTNLGYLRAIQGDVEQARIYYRKALELDPDFGQARVNLEALERLRR